MTPSLNDLLNIKDRAFEKLLAHSLNISGCKPSPPADFFVSRAFNSLKTISEEKSVNNAFLSEVWFHYRKFIIAPRLVEYAVKLIIEAVGNLFLVCY